MTSLSISILGILIGGLLGLNAFLLSDLRKKSSEYCNENRGDHKQIFDELKTLPSTYRTIAECAEKTKECHEFRDRKLETAQKTSEELSKERRENVCRKITGLTERFNKLSNCISGYTKGECS